MSDEQFEFWMNHLQGPLVMFPNTSLDQSWVKELPGVDKPVLFMFFRLYRPLGPRRTEMWSWFAIEEGAPEEFRKAAYRAYTFTLGPAGLMIRRIGIT